MSENCDTKLQQQAIDNIISGNTGVREMDVVRWQYNSCSGIAGQISSLYDWFWLEYRALGGSLGNYNFLQNNRERLKALIGSLKNPEQWVLNLFSTHGLGNKRVTK